MERKSIHQLDEIICHALVVLVDRMHNGVYQGLLVPLTQLCNVAKVHIPYAAIPQREYVAGMGVSMEEAKLYNRECNLRVVND